MGRNPKSYDDLQKEIVRLKCRLEKAEKRTRIGSLTGLPNRRGLEFEAKRALAQADRSETPLSVLFIDLDLFKEVNDTHGHKVGDEMLKGFARFLKEIVRESDIVARPGGDEFVIILPATSLAGAQRLMGKIHKVLSRRRFTRKNLRICASIGHASTEEGFNTFSCLKDRADKRMYEAKGKRRS